MTSFGLKSLLVIRSAALLLSGKRPDGFDNRSFAGSANLRGSKAFEWRSCFQILPAIGNGTDVERNTRRGCPADVNRLEAGASEPGTTITLPAASVCTVKRATQEAQQPEVFRVTRNVDRSTLFESVECACPEKKLFLNAIWIDACANHERPFVGVSNSQHYMGAVRD